ncbi:hypothetical protein NKF26_23570 [Haladaptatus sp. AB618]|uniref:hypothetical protein n=1 Tax=Haladaptatus sp. AB618 TaxID=2934173 RepID=UPI00209C34F7|nr:hypothetical protein [Haladaptatus sp. AB618]MCO8256801.1 hypothetical protein [Haladaptatus sp. AB618]
MRTVVGIGIALILLSGLIHLWLVPEHFEEATYLGGLFVAEFVGTVVAAVGIYRDQEWGWLLGALIAIGAIVAYIVHGTIGLPIVGTEELFEPMGVLTKVIELLFLGVVVYWLVAIKSEASGTTPE